MSHHSRLLFVLSLILLSWPVSAHADRKKPDTCVYQSPAGALVQVESLDKVPAEYRARARCFSGELNTNLAAPADITLNGNIAAETITSSLGPVKLRWPRTVEQLFGRSPLRAVTDAARTVSRVIKTSSFPAYVQNMNVTWNIVFMDENLPAQQIPFNLVSACHPGWMTPPANIYIVAQRVAAGCGNAPRSSTSVADSTLAEVLVHEMGHAVEFQLLKGNSGEDRMRAEGFATWFALYAADYSSIMNGSEFKSNLFQNARYAIRQTPNSFEFQGTALDYARAAMYFVTIVDRRGLPGLMDVYSSITDEHLSFFAAISKKSYWDKKQLDDEVAKRAQKN